MEGVIKCKFSFIESLRIDIDFLKQLLEFNETVRTQIFVFWKHC